MVLVSASRRCQSYDVSLTDQPFTAPGTLAGPLLSWLPDETLFSLCGRLHRLWGYSSSWKSAEVLFGGRRLGLHHDLPSALRTFSSRTGQLLGGPAPIAENRTLLRFYRPFLRPSAVAETVEIMGGPSVAHLKYKLGLLTSRFGANHPLKACTACMTADVDRYGWAYWHAEHQFSGIWMCPVHALPLRVSTLKHNGVERFSWQLPHDRNLTEVLGAPETRCLHALHEFSLWVTELAGTDRDDGWLHAEKVQPTILRRMQDRGWITPAGHVRLKEATKSYVAHCTHLQALPELAMLSTHDDGGCAQVNRLIRPLRSGIHPLRLLVAIHWLFADVGDFVYHHGYQEVPPRPSSSATCQSESAVCRQLTPNRVKAQVLSLVQDGKSATAAAESVGVDVSTAMSWLCAAGLQVRRRPKALKNGKLLDVIRDLHQGTDRSAVAHSYEVSLSTVDKILRTEVGLHAAWQLARQEHARSKARGEWLQVAYAEPDAGATHWRTKCPAAYGWLYRNDRSWLQQHAPAKAVRVQASRKTGVCWETRDRELAEAVRTASMKLAQSQTNKASVIRVGQLCQAVPALKSKMSSLAKLPLTKAAIDSVVGKCKAESQS